MRVGITASAFDLLHAGHISMLEEASSVCDYLICALHVDPSFERDWKNSPVQSVFERYSQLRACRFVDEIIPYQTEADLLDILHSRKIHVRIIGEEYRDQHFTGKHMTPEVYYNRRTHNFSSTELRKRLISREKGEQDGT